MEGDPMTSGNLLRQVYEEVSRGNPRPLLEASLASSRGCGIELATPVVFSIDRVVEEGEWAVLIATGAATTVAGEPHNNTYCIVAHVVDGRFVELTDYVDTDLMRRVLLDAP